MVANSTNKRVLIVDRQAYWRKRSARVLGEAGFQVNTFDNYDHSSIDEQAQAIKPDLIILGCANIEAEEWKLIKHLLSHKYHLLVLCTSLSRDDMRSLFIEGANDVAEKPYDPMLLIDTIKQVLEAIAAADSYQMVEKEGPHE